MKKITLEVEVPEGVDEREVEEMLRKQIRLYTLPVRLLAVKARGEPTREEEKLLKRIKRRVARRAEETLGR